MCVCVRARAPFVDIANTLLRNDLRKSRKVRLGMCQKARFGGEKRMPESKSWVPEVYREVMVRCIRYRKSISGLTGRVPENKAGVSE